jgi:hypothetical protein
MGQHIFNALPQPAQQYGGFAGLERMYDAHTIDY